jgi:hypothetical protein
MPSTPVGVFERLSSIDHLLARGEGVLEEFESALHGPDALAPDAAWTHPAGVVLTRDLLARIASAVAVVGLKGDVAHRFGRLHDALWWADGPHLRAHGDDESPTPPAALSRLAAHWREVFAARALPWAHALRPPQANPCAWPHRTYVGTDVVVAAKASVMVLRRSGGAAALDLRDGRVGPTVDGFFVAVAPDGQTALCQRDGAPSLFALRDGARHWTGEAFASSLNAAAWTPDGARIVAASASELRVLDAATGATLVRGAGLADLKGLLVGDGRVAAWSQRAVAMIDLDTAVATATWAPSAPDVQVAHCVAGDRGFVFVSVYWKGVWALDGQTLAPRWSHPCKAGLGALACDDDGRRVAVGAGDAGVIGEVLDGATGARVCALDGTGWTQGVAMDPGATLIAARDGLWDAHTGARRDAFAGGETAGPLVWSRDGQALARREGTVVRVWWMRDRWPRPRIVHGGAVTQAAVAGDELLCWGRRAGLERWSLAGHLLAREDLRVKAILDDGRGVLLTRSVAGDGAAGEEAWLWDLASGTRTALGRGREFAVRGLDPTGFVKQRDDGVMEAWDARVPRLRWEAHGAFEAGARDGAWVLTREGPRHVLRAWDDGAALLTFDALVSNVVGRDDGLQLACLCGSSVEVWDLLAGARRWSATTSLPRGVQWLGYRSAGAELHARCTWRRPIFDDAETTTERWRSEDGQGLGVTQTRDDDTDDNGTAGPQGAVGEAARALASTESELRVETTRGGVTLLVGARGPTLYEWVSPQGGERRGAVESQRTTISGRE